MKKNFLLVVLAAVVLAACNGNRPSVDDVLNDGETVDLSDVVKAYEKWVAIQVEGDYASMDLPTELEDCDESVGYELFEDTSFVVRVPEYRNSQQPFLRGAEDLYNGCALAFNLLSNTEMPGRELAEEADVVKSIQKIDVSFINNGEVRKEAQRYKDNLIKLLQLPEDEWTEEDGNYMDYVVSFSEAVEKHAYKFYTNEEAFVDSLDSVMEVIQELTQEPFVEYTKADEDKRLEVILRNLNRCKNFDEQCSLLLNWANTPDLGDENEWIIVVAERLMKSGKYSPVLHKVWLVWRCVGQTYYFGSSRDSAIPNKLYNEMRKRCFLTCLKYIEAHPDDVFAMNCAAALAGRANTLRFGRFSFGNDAVADVYSLLPGRLRGDDDEDEEDGDEDEDEDGDEYEYDEEEEGTDNG